jgi:hypothetical protein
MHQAFIRSPHESSLNPSRLEIAAWCILILVTGVVGMLFLV